MFRKFVCLCRSWVGRPCACAAIGTRTRYKYPCTVPPKLGSARTDFPPKIFSSENFRFGLKNTTPLRRYGNRHHPSTPPAAQDAFTRRKKPRRKIAGKHLLNGRCKHATELRPSWAVSKENKKRTKGKRRQPRPQEVAGKHPLSRHAKRATTYRLLPRGG